MPFVADFVYRPPARGGGKNGMCACSHLPTSNGHDCVVENSFKHSATKGTGLIYGRWAHTGSFAPGFFLWNGVKFGDEEGPSTPDALRYR